MIGGGVPTVARGRKTWDLAERGGPQRDGKGKKRECRFEPLQSPIEAQELRPRTDLAAMVSKNTKHVPKDLAGEEGEVKKKTCSTDAGKTRTRPEG